MKLPRHKKAIEAKVVFGTQKPKCNAFDQSRRGAGISGQVYIVWGWILSTSSRQTRNSVKISGLATKYPLIVAHLMRNWEG